MHISEHTLVKTTNSNNSIPVAVRAIESVAADINLYELRPLTSDSLPIASAGSHIDLNLANELIRQYSLLDTPLDPKSYRIAVKLNRMGRGGSSFIFDRFTVGCQLTISHPRNNFHLIESAKHSVFIAGGIGITPIMAMTRRLSQIAARWQLFYAASSRQDAAFVDELAKYDDVFLHFDSEQSGRLLDVPAIVATQPPGSHLYCCGPSPMLHAFRTVTSSIPEEFVHVEYFSAANVPDRDGGFSITAARSGRQHFVKAGLTILEVLHAAGYELPFSCEQGICGTCETRVLAGIPDHRNSILTPSERDSNASMMICCSGSKTDELVLDI